MLLDLGYVAAGLVLLFIGGEGLVRGSVAIAERLGISKLLIGLVIVGFGTSTPELLVSVNAALDGAPEIALGNAVGSNIANVLLIVGVAVAILPIAGWERTAVREALVATLVALVLVGLVQGAYIERLEGAAMLTVLIGYLFASYWLERRSSETDTFQQEAAEFEDIPIGNVWVSVAFVVAGIAALVFGADLLVGGAVNIARAFGVSEAVIGLSLVAVGTSLPELATAITAAIRRHSDVVLGNVIGSNIFNILAILGTTAVILPIEVSERFREFDTHVMLAASVLLLGLLAVAPRISRLWGIVMLGAYGAYMTALFLGGTTT
ncbi:calcium/sodium antiporter [Jhaorihella thermophila]|uniref:Cation:H+ antiporter n=2 Tax=Jhaorihella thermophila TaxID=488547 RepID=A0A1H5YUH0_9RHOB|nr:calcium/sodium antiporter [Jhaorihella thermophila]SEG27909.1 cation:H+ antiporter [Jhaorihella thermophila]